MLGGVAIYALAFAEPDELNQLRGDAFATIAYVANWRYVFTGASYFDQFVVPSPLRHTWSLAIEEQFYIVWPLLVVLLLSLRRGSVALLITGTLALIAGSVLLMAWLYEPNTDPSRVYYGTDTRAQSLLIGAVLAMVLISYNPLRTAASKLIVQGVAAVSAVALVWLWATTADDSVFLYRGGYLLLALAVASVIAAVVQPERGLLAKLLSAEPLRRLGLISYGVYLWHWPIYLVLTTDRTGMDGAALLAIRIALTLALSIASYYLLEMPVRRGTLRWPRASWAVAPAAAIVLAIVLVFATRGGEAPDTAWYSAESSLSAWARSQETGATRVMLVGDSVAHSMAIGLRAQEEESQFVLHDASLAGCGVVPGNIVFNGNFIDTDGCTVMPERWQGANDRFRPDVIILVVSALDAFTHVRDGHSVPAGTPAADSDFNTAMQDAIDLLSSSGAPLLLLTAPYFNPFTIKDAEIDKLNALALTVARENAATVTVLDLNRVLGPDGDYTASIDGVRVRQSDNTHLSEAGADLVANWLVPMITEIADGTSTPGTTTDVIFD